MAGPRDSAYDTYAKHRLAERLAEQKRANGTWPSIAEKVADANGVPYFATSDLHLVRKKQAGRKLCDRVVRWLETLDPNIRDWLRPEAIFTEMGVSARDYYFNLSEAADLDEWDENLLTTFAGIYLCAPEDDAHSYLPSPYVRTCLEKRVDLPEEWRKSRSVDVRGYISQRSYLILRRTGGHYYHAAEIPMAALFPSHFDTLDIKTFYEGIGIASANSLHLILRECLSCVPKIHSILIRPKVEQKNLLQLPGTQLYYDTTIRHLPQEVGRLPPEMREHMEAEFTEDLASDVFMRGTSQVSISPSAYCHSAVQTVFGTEQVYHRKPRFFMRDKSIHFIRPDLEIGEALDRLADNPLSVGSFSHESRTTPGEPS